MREPSPPHTGVPAVDAALHDIADLDQVPLSEHADRFERLHTALTEALNEDTAAHHRPGETPPEPAG